MAQAQTAVLGGLAALAAAAGTALWVESRARRAEREHAPAGRFVHVDGVRLHYVERGDGPPVVLLHGNVVTCQDFEASGLIARLAQDHRVIAFDRPGFGHSGRPREREWTPALQAALLHRACASLGIQRPVVLGHSIGTMVALSMALDHPGSVGGLVLVGGYHYPTLRLDALLASPAAWPLVGDVMRHTVTALSARALLESMVAKMFSPQPVPAGYLQQLGRELLLRPSQLRAGTEDGTFMMPQARASAPRYTQLRLPLTLIAGGADEVVEGSDHSARLHREVPHSRYLELPGSGHMAHHADPEAVTSAVTQMHAELGGAGVSRAKGHSRSPDAPQSVAGELGALSAS